MCDGSITTMVSNQSRLRYCWVVYSNSQSNDRLSSNESRSSSIASSSGSTRTLTGNVLNSYKNPMKTPKDNAGANASNERAKANDDIEDDDLASVHLMLEPHLRPAPPDPNSELSKQIYEEHKQLAKDYLRIQTEIAYVTKHRDEILSKMDARERQKRLEICNKMMEKEELLTFRANLKRQLELIRLNSRPPPNTVPVSTVPVTTPTATSTPTPPQQRLFSRQNSNSSVTTNDDGWVLVSSQAESEA